MSSAEKAAGLLLELEPEEFRVLQAIELGMASFSFVPMDELLKYAKMPQREIEFRLGALNKKDLIYRQYDPYPGYILNYTGYDLLALNALSKADILSSLGRSSGVGKEATTRPSRTATKPPPISTIALAATARSTSEDPTTTTF